MYTDVKRRINQLGIQLGIPTNVLECVNLNNWVDTFKEKGAENWDERYRVHDSNNPGLRELSLISPGAEIAAISQNNKGKWYIAIQVRNNGEKREKDREIGVPGGASELWGYTPKGESKRRVVLEHPLLTAYREWREEVGIIFPYKVDLLTVVTTTNTYGRYPDAYAMSLYFYGEVPWQYMEEIQNLTESSEGKMKVIPITELTKYKWFPDAAECFEILMSRYAK